MSWLRFGNLDRFSPFTRSPPQGSTTVSDADFSYITNDDLKRHAALQNDASSVQNANASQDLGPPRDTDVLALKNKRDVYLVHFPAYSIAKGELVIGQVRDAAAKKFNIDARKVKLLYKGRNLTDNNRQCFAEGLKEGSEILCALGEGVPGSDTEGSEGEDDSGGADLNASGKKKRSRNNRNRRKKAPQQPEPVGDMLNPPRPAPRAPSPAKSTGTSTPLTAKDKIIALHATLKSYEQDVQAYIRSPPADPAKRQFEHKRLSETILTQVLLKTDAVETEGDADARTRRKELVKDCQNVLKLLDDAGGATE